MGLKDNLVVRATACGETRYPVIVHFPHDLRPEKPENRQQKARTVRMRAYRTRQSRDGLVNFDLWSSGSSATHESATSSHRHYYRNVTCPSQRGWQGNGNQVFAEHVDVVPNTGRRDGRGANADACLTRNRATDSS